MVCLFLKFSTCTEQGLVYLHFQANILYWETLEKAFEPYLISLCLCLLLDHNLPPWWQEMQLCSGTSSTVISSPPILGLSPANGTTRWAQWGQKGMPLLSYLLCGFYVCSKPDSTVQKISCEVICVIVHLLLGFIINSEHVTLLYY